MSTALAIDKKFRAFYEFKQQHPGVIWLLLIAFLCVLGLIASAIYPDTSTQAQTASPQPQGHYSGQRQATRVAATQTVAPTTTTTVATSQQPATSTFYQPPVPRTPTPATIAQPDTDGASFGTHSGALPMAKKRDSARAAKARRERAVLPKPNHALATQAAPPSDFGVYSYAY